MHNKILPNKILFAVSVILSCTALGEDRIESFFAIYKDDANLSVMTPSIGFTKSLGDRTVIHGEYIFEKFDKEAPPPADNQLDAVSGATSVSGGSAGSGFQEKRSELALTGTHQTAWGMLSGGLFLSQEDDFDSSGLLFGLSREFARKNFNLSSSFGINNDQIQKIGATPQEAFPRNKDVAFFSVSATQLLGPRAFISTGYQRAQVGGYQSLPLRAVLITSTTQGGNAVTRQTHEEVHPENRLRNTFFLRSKRYFRNRSALDTAVSFYNDDWGVTANAMDVRYYHYLTGALVMRLRYQVYDQSKADFFQPVYARSQPFMTADSRLRAFQSTLAGIKFTYDLSAWGLHTWRTSLGVDLYDENNQGLSATIVKLKLSVPIQ